MNAPTLLRGVGVALVLSLVGAAVFALVQHLAGPATAVRLVITLTAGGYLFWLVPTSGVRIGRVTTSAAWISVSLALWFLAPSLTLYLLGHVVALWLVRSLYFHSGVLPALADLGLAGLAVGAALWAAGQSGSVFLATWSFYLAQAFFVLIPQTSSPSESPATAESESNFNRSQRMAEAALRRISTNH